MKNMLLIMISLLFIASCTGHIGTDTTKSGATLSTSKEVRTLPTPTIGTGQKKLEVFMDFQCGACQNFSKTMEPVFIEYAKAGKLRIEYRQYPLTHIHKNAYRDALAVLCGAEEGKFEEAKRALYDLEITKKGQPITDAERLNVLSGAGLNPKNIETCLTSDAYATQIDADLAYGTQMKVTGTPTLILDGKKLDLRAFTDLGVLRKFLDEYTQ